MVIPDYEVSKDIDFDQPFITNSRMVKVHRVQFRGKLFVTFYYELSPKKMGHILNQNVID